MRLSNGEARVELRHLRYFAAVAEQLNFRRAAESLNTSQPSLSQQIRALEDELGVTLFERTKRRVRLTSAGAEYLAGVRSVIADLEATAARARDAQNGLRGVVTVAANSMVVVDHLPQAVRAFRRSFPEVRLSISIMRSPDVVNAVRGGRVQLAISSGAYDDDELVTRKLWSFPLRVVLPADHRLAARERVRLAELHDTLITHPRRGGFGANDNVMALCRAHGFTPESITEVAEIADLESQLGLVACGLGVTILPAPFERLSPRNVVFKAIDGPDAFVDVAACWRRGTDDALIANFVAAAEAVTAR